MDKVTIKIEVSEKERNLIEELRKLGPFADAKIVKVNGEPDRLDEIIKKIKL